MKFSLDPTKRYTVRLDIQIRNSRRKIREFIRPENAINTSSHATGYATIEEAESAAETVRRYFEENGHTYLGHAIFDRARNMARLPNSDKV